MTIHSPLCVDVEQVFGPAERSGKAQLKPAGAVISRQRDLAAMHSLKCEAFAFKSRSIADASIQNLTVSVILPRGGEVRVDQLKSSHIVRPGDVIAISNWTPFQLSSPGLDAMVVQFPAWWAFQKFISISPLHPDYHLDGAAFAAPALHLLARTLFERELAPEETVRAISALSEMLRIAFDVDPQDSQAIAPAGRFGRLYYFIAQNIHVEDISPQDAAAYLRCSVRTIHKTCSDHGTSFSAIVMDIRLSFATYLLSATDNRISQIAFSSGFGSLSHFCRLFKARLGESATQYRRRYHLN